MWHGWGNFWIKHDSNWKGKESSIDWKRTFYRICKEIDDTLHENDILENMSKRETNNVNDSLK